MGTDSLQIDHVVLAGRSFQTVAASLRRAGLTYTTSRALTGAGISNVVVPLSASTFLEIHYPNAEEPSPDAPAYRQIEEQTLACHPEVELIPVMWLVRSESEDRLREVSSAHDCPPVESADQEPGLPNYVLGGFGPAVFQRRWLPSLIHWRTGNGLPAIQPCTHPRNPTGGLTLTVSGPAEEIIDWCGGAPDGLRAVEGTAGLQSLTIHFDTGEPEVFGLA